METLLAICASLLVKWCVGINGYSGKGVPPMYGDFEAQRHWLEVTVNLLAREWYHYDLQYWGLDYPPLTAYHSFVLGTIAKFIEPSWVALNSSRGFESSDLQLFMRCTALMTDVAIYTSGAVAFARLVWQNETQMNQNLLLLLLLIQPGLVLIDHGHFQYNSAMLGFALWAVIFLFRSKHALASVMFCLSLCFKQISLYYALPIFFFLLGQCRTHGINLFLKLGATVLLTFLVCFLPFLRFEDVAQVFFRVFPLGRGLFEDKVANFWCAASVLIKFRMLFEISTLVRISLVTTLVAVLPSSVSCIVNPNPKRLLCALTTGSLGFFLFAFQVHEKSILLPVMPATLLIRDEPVAAVLLNNVAIFSMYPLLKKDELVLPSIAVTVLFNLIAMRFVPPLNMRMRSLLMAVHAVMVLLITTEFILPPPQRYPDIYPVLNSIFSALILITIFIILNRATWGMHSEKEVKQQTQPKIKEN